MPTKKSVATVAVTVPTEVLERRIYLIRGQKVMLDSDLAQLYKVQTKAFNQAVRRNRDRFPEDFMFQLTESESSALRSQFVTLEKGRGRYSKYSSLAFTELDLARKMDQVEARLRQHSSAIGVLVDEIKKLKHTPPAQPRRRIGFAAEPEK